MREKRKKERFQGRMYVGKISRDGSRFMDRSRWGRRCIKKGRSGKGCRLRVGSGVGSANVASIYYTCRCFAIVDNVCIVLVSHFKLSRFITTYPDLTA